MLAKDDGHVWRANAQTPIVVNDTKNLMRQRRARLRPRANAPIVLAPDPLQAERDRFMLWPNVKFIDFGSARLTHANDPTNPASFNDAVTRSYMPREHFNGWGPQNPTIPNPPDRILAHTNVYQIGLVIRELMCYPTPLAPRNYTIPAQRKINLDDPPRKYKSETMLTNLVERCVKYDPAQRITVHELVNALDRKVDTRTFREKVTKVLQTVRPRGNIELVLPQRYQDDQYRVGLTLPADEVARGVPAIPRKQLR